MTLTIKIRESVFTLHQSGALFWNDKNMLLISDVHLGKVAHFRKHGIAIPEKARFENFKRLDAAIDFFKPETVVFLGDLFHSKINKEWDWFADWVQSTAVKIILIEGNHDIIARKNYSDLNIDYFPELQIGDFVLTHHPKETSPLFNFCGHIHPGIKLHEVGRQSLQLACFFQKPDQLILPAFGEFTGKYYLRPTEADMVYAVTKEEVILIN